MSEQATHLIDDVMTIGVPVSDQDRALAFYPSGVEVDELLRWPGVPPMFAFRDPDRNRHAIVEAA
ncbi:MAG TPA: hypothetical protein VMA77_14890 [Solirubrobacteraceae bacterium]|nr:hypothetical protein [Solirubrobacteraceae bacterium]